MASPDAAPSGKSAVVQINLGWALTTPTPDSGSTSKFQFQPEPRLFNASQVASRLGKGETWLYDHLAQLTAQGFPARDPLLGGWDAMAIERWWDKRSEIVEPDAANDNAIDELMEKWRNEEN